MEVCQRANHYVTWPSLSPHVFIPCVALPKDSVQNPAIVEPMCCSLSQPGVAFNHHAFLKFCSQLMSVARKISRTNLGVYQIKKRTLNCETTIHFSTKKDWQKKKSSVEKPKKPRWSLLALESSLQVRYILCVIPVVRDSCKFLDLVLHRRSCWWEN